MLVVASVLFLSQINAVKMCENQLNLKHAYQFYKSIESSNLEALL